MILIDGGEATFATLQEKDREKETVQPGFPTEGTSIHSQGGKTGLVCIAKYKFSLPIV